MVYRTCLLVFVATLGFAGCGGDDEKSGSEPAAVAMAVTPSGQGRFQLQVPESVEAGLVRLEFRNGTEDTGEALLIRGDDEHTIQDALAVIGADDSKIPSWLHAVGGVGQTKPGESGAVELVLEEGTYYVLDVGEPNGDDVKSHAEQGATATLEVSAGDDEAELPEVAASLEMNEYSFVPKGLKPGVNRFLLRNAGDELHHTLFVPIREGVPFAQVRKFVTSQGEGGGGPPPLDFTKLRGTTVLDGGREQIDQVELAAGRYAMLCFLTDRAGGPPHVAKGMVGELTIPG